MIPLWMFPLAVTAGNSFVLKPSERDPGAAMMLASMAKEAGLPDGETNQGFLGGISGRRERGGEGKRAEIPVRFISELW